MIEGKMNVIVLLIALICVISTAQTTSYFNETALVYSTAEEGNVSERSRQRRSYYSTRDSLYCPPCEQIHCYKHRKRRLHCKGGYTVGVCGCCRVCAKVENEQCGGDHNYLGRCDRGLVCDPQPATEVSLLKDGVKTVYRVQKGICRKNLASTALVSKQCKPECSPDYCMENPRAICSAKKNVENYNSHENWCQHTSCRACRYVEPEKHCSKCAMDDFRCIREFGRCIRQKACKPKSYPCGNQMVMHEPQ